MAKAEERNIRQMTPKMRIERHNYRDYCFIDNNDNKTRPWVAQRMKVYSIVVKNTLKPKISEKKQIELQIMKEKNYKQKTLSPSRVKFVFK